MERADGIKAAQIFILNIGPEEMAWEMKEAHKGEQKTTKTHCKYYIRRTANAIYRHISHFN